MGAKEDFIRNRVNMPTARDSAGIAQIPAQIRARAFFSARVAEAHILERFRQIADAYTTGKISRDEARHLLMQYARQSGKDDGTESLKNLASTARLNLILDQNAKMARAVGEHERMYSAAAKKIFPYMRYHASVGSANPRSTHQRYDGLIFDKDDPWLRTHTPPWEFGCNCQLEQITAKEAGRTPGNIQPMTPPEQVKVESKSGFAFDPESAFDDFDMSSIKNLDERRKIYRSMASLAMKTDARTSFLAAPAKPVPTCAKPDNLNEITGVITQVKRAIDDHKPNTPYEFPDVKCSLGYIAQERFDAIGMQPEDNVPVIFEAPGAAKYGMRHWKKHHLDDWKRKDFVNYLLNMLRQTIWRPTAVMRDTFDGKSGRRIEITSPDRKYVANLWRKDGAWLYSIQDAWDWEKSQTKSK